MTRPTHPPTRREVVGPQNPHQRQLAPRWRLSAPNPAASVKGIPCDTGFGKWLPRDVGSARRAASALATLELPTSAKRCAVQVHGTLRLKPPYTS